MSTLPDFAPTGGPILIRTVEFFHPADPIRLTDREAAWIEGMYSKGLTDAQVRGIVGQGYFEAYQQTTDLWQPST